jgi:hypothetical protein
MSAFVESSWQLAAFPFRVVGGPSGLPSFVPFSAPATIPALAPPASRLFPQLKLAQRLPLRAVYTFPSARVFLLRLENMFPSRSPLRG